MTRRNILLIALACALSAFVAPAPGAAAEEHREDAELVRRIEERLLTSPLLTTTPIRVTVDEGHALLEGEIPTLWVAWAAEHMAGQVFGLKSVRVDLPVYSRASDRAIEGELRAEFRELSRWQDLRVSVTDGRVTLTGRLADSRSRLGARKKAARVRGVVEVIVAIETPQMSDEAISDFLARRFSPRAMLRVEGRITPEVMDGVVTLSGSVPRPSARIDAEHIVWEVNGVQRVVNRIEVVPEIPGGPRVIQP